MSASSSNVPISPLHADSAHHSMAAAAAMAMAVVVPSVHHDELSLTQAVLEATRQELTDLRAALNEAAIVAITDSRGRITFANDKFCSISRFPREELLGQDHRIINSGHHPREFFTELWRTISHGRVWKGEIKNRAKDGTFYWVDTTIVPFLDSAGYPYQYYAIRADITERKMAEERLLASHKEVSNLRYALDQHAIVAITTPRGQITFVNDKFCSISKYPREELLGQDHRIINSGHHPRTFFTELWRTISRGKVWKGEIKNRAKDGTFYWVDTTIVPFLDAEGKPTQYVAIRADVTERINAQEKLQKLNDELELRVALRTQELEAANKELEAFSYSVSHDLRSPLRAVDGFSQALMEDCIEILPEQSMEDLRTVRQAAQKMGVLIDDLLTFSRLGRAPLARREVDMERLVRSTIEELRAERADREIEFRIGPLPHGSGDPALLHQVWVNLISNAVKYTKKRAAAIIEIGCCPADGEPLGEAYFVRDNGAGFNMRYADKLFGVFQRLHRAEEYEGTGVGLAIVQRIVHRHGGRAWAEALQDVGATFYFSLGPGSG